MIITILRTRSKIILATQRDIGFTKINFMSILHYSSYVLGYVLSQVEIQWCSRTAFTLNPMFDVHKTHNVFTFF